MSDIWIPGFEQIVNRHGRTGGQYLAGVAPKVCLHTVEGYSMNPRTTFANHPWIPHCWVTRPSHPYAPRCKLQSIPLQRSSYALSHPPGTYETNNAGPTQFEIEGFAAEAHLWSTEDLDWLAAECVAPVCELTAVDPKNFRVCYGSFDGIVPVLATKESPIRFDGGPEYYYYNGLHAHQHGPDQDHWDCGKLFMAYISAKCVQLLTPGEPAPPPIPDVDDDLAVARWLVAICV